MRDSRQREWKKERESDREVERERERRKVTDENVPNGGGDGRAHPEVRAGYIRPRR